MKRLQISLEPELDQALGREADRQGVSKAEIVRRRLREELQSLHPFDEDPLFKLFGTGESKADDDRSIDDIVYGPRD
jgi:hypothetical protein